MKKPLLVLLTLIAPFTYQSIKAQAVPDSSFTVWSHNALPSYNDPNLTPLTGNGWQDLNVFSSPLYGSSPVSVFKDSLNYHSAPYSAEITTVKLSLFTIAFLGGNIPNDTLGIMFVGNINGTTITSGYPFTNRMTGLNFYYEYAPVGSDTGFVYALLTKWNTISNQRDTVAQGGFHVNTTIASFTQGTVNLTYSANYLTTGNPDTAQILVSSSSFVSGKANPGSTMWVDDFTWSNVATGTTPLSEKNKSITVYPNPAGNSVTFTLPDNKTHILNIFDITGKKIESMEVNKTTAVVNTEAFSEGLYIYQVMDISGTPLQTGKLSIVK